jgi:acyl carrier protein
MRHPSVSSDMGLAEVGMSSMTTIIVVSELKKVYKIQLSVRDCFNSETVGDLVGLIEARLDQEQQPRKMVSPLDSTSSTFMETPRECSI